MSAHSLMMLNRTRIRHAHPFQSDIIDTQRQRAMRKLCHAAPPLTLLCRFICPSDIHPGHGLHFDEALLGSCSEEDKHVEDKL